MDAQTDLGHCYMYHTMSWTRGNYETVFMINLEEDQSSSDINFELLGGILKLIT